MILQTIAGLLGPLLFFLCAFLTGCGGGGEGTDAQAPAPRAGPDLSIEIDADSLFAAHNIERSVVAQLARLRPDLRITDKAVPGLTMRSLANGYTTPFKGAAVPPFGPQPPFDQVRRTARYIVLQLGTNDAYSNYPPGEFEQQLRAAVRTVQSEGRVPLLAGFGPFTAGAVFDADTVARAAVLTAITHQVAAEMGVAHLGLDQPLSPEEAETLDGLHPTQRASDLKALRLAEATDAVMKEAVP